MAQAPVRIYHNPRCSKSREALALLRERGVEPEVVLYLEQTPSAAQLEQLIGKLGMAAHDVLRTKEAAYAEAQLSKSASASAVVEAIGKAPILLERPIVEVGNKAVIARPPEKLLELL